MKNLLNIHWIVLTVSILIVLSSSVAEAQTPELEFIQVNAMEVGNFRIPQAAWSFDDRYLAILGSGYVVIWDTNTWEQVVFSSFCDSHYAIKPLNWAPDRYDLLVGCDYDTFNIIGDVHSEIRFIEVPAWHTPHWSRDGRLIASQRNDGTFWIFSDSLDVIKVVGEPYPEDPLGLERPLSCPDMKWSPDSDYIALMCAAQGVSIQILDVNQGEIIRAFVHATRLVWSDDGSTFTLTEVNPELITASSMIWTIEPLEMISRIEIPFEYSRYIEEQPDNRSYRVSCNNSLETEISDAISGQIIMIDFPENETITCPISHITWSSGNYISILDQEVFTIWNVYETYPSDTIISGQVWQDVNGDGLQTDESGGNVNGITVHLRDVNNNIVDTAVTNLNGIYRFVINPNTDYFIEAVLPSNLSFTTQQVGDDDTIDSDVNVATGRIEGINLAVGGRLRTLDIGLIDTPLTNLRLTSMCSPDPDTTRVWRVRNENAVDVNYTWDVVGTQQAGSGVATANSDVFFETQTVPDSPNTVRLFVDGEQQQVKASNPAACDPPDEVCVNIDFNSYAVTSYGSSQDTNGTFTVEDNGSTLRLVGNTWQQIAFPYTLTEETVLRFDFTSSNQGEIHGIGFDAGSNSQAVSKPTVYRVYGTQSWGRSDIDTYATYAPATQSYEVRVGEDYTGEYSYLTFVMDHDVSTPTADSVFSNVQVCEIPLPTPTCTLQSVVSYIPGTRVSGEPISSSRTDASQALGTPEDDDTENFVSLGFGGELIVDFGQAVFNESGTDIQVYETSYNDHDRPWSGYPEQAEVYGSQDGQTWTLLGVARKDSSFDLGDLDWIQYLRIVDTTDPADFSVSNQADGFDVDGVQAYSTCDVPPTQ